MSMIIAMDSGHRHRIASYVLTCVHINLKHISERHPCVNMKIIEARVMRGDDNVEIFLIDTFILWLNT